MDILKILPRRYYTVDGVTYLVTNLSANFNVSQDTRESSSLFLKYTIRDNETPRDIAERLYDNRDLYWTILVFNGMTNSIEDWPKSSSDLYEQTVREFGYEGLDEIVHYLDDVGNLVDIPGVRFQNGLSDSVPDDQTVIEVYNLTPVSRFEMIEQTNEQKRKVKLLDPRFMEQFIANVREEMK